MDTKNLRNYAPEARRAFIAAVTNKAAVYGLMGDGSILPMKEEGDVVIIGDRPFPRSIARQRSELETLIRENGFPQFIESIAYTWFNRFVAIRYMELHGYLDHGYRVLSHPQGRTTPEILENAERIKLPGLDRDKVVDLKLDGRQDELLYQMLLLAQCAELNRILPTIFGKLDDATVLLLPDNLLHSDSVIRQLISSSEEADWEQVEVLGWLYQFYISERKDQVMARKSAVPTDDIPAVTQLFTPHWIVRYLVENSLGRLWLLNRPGSSLREHMPYYIEGEAETDFLKINKPEEIRLCDPACGSGHMLTYAFDLLSLIYKEEGYAPNDIPILILRHNLHGLEICPRAAQLAELALVFKAREKSRRFLQPENFVRPNILELCNVRFDEHELNDYVDSLALGSLFNQSILKSLQQFEEAKNFGSLIQPCIDGSTIAFVRQAIEAKNIGGQLFLRETHIKVLRVLEQAEALTQRYHVIVANPPYMGGRQMNGQLRTFAQCFFIDSKSDVFAMFIERGFSLVLPNGYAAQVTMQSWMFLASYLELRIKLLRERTILTSVHMDNMVMGIAFGTVATIWHCSRQKELKGNYSWVTLDDLDETRKPKAFPIKNERLASISSENFEKIPGSPIAYWVSPGVFRMLKDAELLGSISDARMGLATGDNSKYVRLWYECGKRNIGFAMSNRMMAQASGKRWFPYCKGGAYRKWYGNNEYVVDWFDDGKALQTTMHPSGTRVWAHNFNLNCIFRDSITWSDVTSGYLSVRYNPPGFLFDGSGTCAFLNSESEKLTALGLLNTTFVREFAKVLNPTLHFQTGDFRNIPFKSNLGTPEFQGNVNCLIEIARHDWDNLETSWDFSDNPLLRSGLKAMTLEECWRNWEAQCIAAIHRTQQLETENNRLFIAAYGLEGELEPEVPEAQITLARADARRDMAAFLSYAVGCMMGRYSPDCPGLVLANAGDTLREFQDKVGKPLNELSFIPDEDGIIPVLDGEWFDDDIVVRIRAFLDASFGESSQRENVRFIEDSLGKELRTYLLNDFYKDHLQAYKKRPIYWLFSSGKQKAFQCLVYLHRYNAGTLSRMRTEYVVKLQSKFQGRIEQLETDIATPSSTSHRKKLEKEREKLIKQLEELRQFDEKLRHFADQRIELNLDDGVKVNYAKFGDLLADVKSICGTKDDE